MPTKKQKPSQQPPHMDLFDTPAPAPTHRSDIRVGIGGWTYAPWRGGMFYPTGLVQRLELEYASRQLNSIEINSTYYGTQPPGIYARWAEQTPDDFLFSVKAPKRITGARRLAGTGGQVDDFIDGISALGEKLGPLVWQFADGQVLDHDDVAAFLQLLPANAGKRRLQHVVEIRDPAAMNPAMLALLRQHQVALTYTDAAQYPSFADLTGPIVYARLMRSQEHEATGYPDTQLAAWCERAKQWADGDDPADLPHITPTGTERTPRQVFIYFISSAKQRNTAAAMALLQRLNE